MRVGLVGWGVRWGSSGVEKGKSGRGLSVPDRHTPHMDHAPNGQSLPAHQTRCCPVIHAEELEQRDSSWDVCIATGVLTGSNYRSALPPWWSLYRNVRVLSKRRQSFGLCLCRAVALLLHCPVYYQQTAVDILLCHCWVPNVFFILVSSVHFKLLLHNIKVHAQ